MDFFEAQARAHQRTHRLVALFILAVLGTIAAGYFATIFGAAKIAGSENGRPQRRGYYAAPPAEEPPLQLWQPDVLAIVAMATFAIVGGASLYKWTQFHAGGSAVAESVGARRVDLHSTDPAERRLLNVVEEMSIAAGLPMPAVYVLDDETAINAFAAGLTSGDATVTVTRGALETLSRDELQGIIGHEFSHILNGDMRLNLKLAAVIFGILVIGLTGRAIFWGLFRGRVRSNRNSGGAVIMVVAAGVALLIIGYVGYFFGRLIQAAVSRQREFLADASSVQFTRNPAGIAGALKKIGGSSAGSALETHKAAEIGHFFFAQAFTSSFGSVWATHPPLEARIRAIDSNWDGKFSESAVSRAEPPPLSAPPPAPPARHPQAAIAAIGTLTAAAILSAQGVRDNLPSRLLAATRSAIEAPLLIFGLLLSPDPAVAQEQRRMAGADAAATLDALAPALAEAGPGHKLTLVQLSVPALRLLPPEALGVFFTTLNALIQADGRVDPFEYALQKMLRRSLTLARQPVTAAPTIFLPEAAAAEIAVVLSAMAHAASDDKTAAAAAFAAGADQLGKAAAGVALLAPAACGIPQLDAALDRLGGASLAVKRILIAAASHVVGADGAIPLAEAELLRAVSAALDVPMPPLPS